MPATASSSVVLPAPLGPTIATSSPGSSVNDTASSTVSSLPLRSFTRCDRSSTSIRTPRDSARRFSVAACLLLRFPVRLAPALPPSFDGHGDDLDSLRSAPRRIRPEDSTIGRTTRSEYDRSCYLVKMVAKQKRRRRRANPDAIVREAVTLATVDGLEGLSIGNLAGALDMSKSGVYAHFGSKQELQLATVDEAAQIFRREVIEPALAATPGTRAARHRVRRVLRPPRAAHVPRRLLLRRRGLGDGHSSRPGEGERSRRSSSSSPTLHPPVRGDGASNDKNFPPTRTPTR